MIPFTLTDRQIVSDARKNYLDYLQNPVAFLDETNDFVFKVINQYYAAFETFPDRDTFSQTLTDNQIEPEKKARAVLRFNECQKQTVTPDKFAFYHTRALTQQEKQNLSTALEESLVLLHGPAEIETEDGESITSVAAAKEKIIPALFSDSSDSSRFINGDMPDGDITTEAEDILREYEEAKLTGGVVNGIKTGIRKIDKYVTMVPGDVTVIGGATGEGKSWFAVQVAHNAAMVQNKNVVVVTAETVRNQYRRRLLVRHSNDPKFAAPLQMGKVKKGQLSAEEEEIFHDVIKDFTSGEHGSIDVMQVSTGTTLQDIRFRLERKQLTKPVDIVIIDYLTLLASKRRRGSAREEFVEIFKDAKQLAVTFNRGKGLCVVALAQVSLQARNAAKWEPGKFYTLSALADTSEASKSADNVIFLFRDENMIASHEIGLSIAKCRDGELPQGNEGMFVCFESFAHGLIADLED